MDRISRALEKDRQRRAHRPGAVPRSTPRVMPKNGSKSGSAANPASSSNPLADLEYTHTRQVSIPQSTLSENRVVAGNPSDPRAASFKILRTQVLHAMRNNGWNSLAIVGPQAGVGKSLVAANLAVSMSLEVNQTVLLVDLDLRKPSLHKYFGFEPDYGLLDYLHGDVQLDKVLVNPNFKRLVMLPCKGATIESSEILSSPQMVELVKELKERYPDRITLFDLPPLLTLDDALVFIPNVDAALLVVENAKNTESDVTKSIRMLSGTNLIGTVLNKGEDDTADYY